MTDKLNPGEIAAMLSEAGIDVRSATWPDPGFVIANGETLVPTMLSGLLIVDGSPMYSAAWR